MKPVIDILGQRFGRLLVLSREPNDKRGSSRWRCRCDCGGEKTTTGAYLRKGLSKSCGCLVREHAVRMGAATRTHGHAVLETVEYKALRSAIARCHNPKHKSYPNYGGRGIEVCQEWRDDFSAFLEHVGPRPAGRYSLDRRDNSRGYEPGNVHWATYGQQLNNTRVNHIVDVDGVKMTLAQAIRLKGQKSNVVRSRLALGWTVERALNEIAHPRPFKGRRQPIQQKAAAP